MNQNNSDKNSALEKLHALGLTEKEAEIYFAGVTMGALSVNDLAHHTEIKRPTVYHCLETLREKGLVSERRGFDGRVFIMSEPASIGQVIERKKDALAQEEDALAELIPLFQLAQKETGKEMIDVMRYAGESGVKTALDEALYCKGRVWEVIAPTENFLSDQSDRVFAEYYLATRKERDITARTLWEENRGKKLSSIDKAARNPRVLPGNLKGLFRAMMILFDDKTLIISSRENATALLINSKEMTDFTRTLFEGLWQISSEVK